MPFNVQEFRSQLQMGGARNTLFEVVLPFPGYAGGSASSQKLAFMCKSSQIPPQDIGFIEVPYFGRKIKVAGDRTFPEWQITIINDEDFIVRDAFERWHNALNYHVANLRAQQAATLIQYQVDAKVTQYAKTGEPLKVYTFVGVFPTNIGAIDLGWDTTDQIEEFPVTLQYQWWNTDTTQ